MQNREARTDMAREDYFWSGLRGRHADAYPCLARRELIFEVLYFIC
jgi:hypothetical protein